jgi:hypothetical protein
MTWADRLLRLATGDRTREVIEYLRDMRRRSVEQTRRLEAAAGQSPTESAETELRSLAAAQNELTNALDTALAERPVQTAPTAPPASTLNGATRNHWARLVAALDACRDNRAHLARTIPNLVDADPSIAGLLDNLDRGYHAQSLALRTLIARADPQALD